MHLPNATAVPTAAHSAPAETSARLESSTMTSQADTLFIIYPSKKKEKPNSGETGRQGLILSLNKNPLRMSTYSSFYTSHQPSSQHLLHIGYSSHHSRYRSGRTSWEDNVMFTLGHGDSHPAACRILVS